MADTPTNDTKGALDVIAANEIVAKTGTTARPTIANQSILEEMQKLYNEKKAEKQSFMEDMKDASAWWSGGAAGPTTGLALRAQTRAQQAKNLEDLQASVMQGKVNLAQLSQANEELKPGQQALSGAMVPVGGSAGSQQTNMQTNAAGERLIPYKGLMVPERVYRVIKTYVDSGNKAKADEEFAKYVAEESKFVNNPGSYKQDPYFDGREITAKAPIQLRNGVSAPTVNPQTTQTNLNTPVQGFQANDAKVQKTEGGFKPVDGTSGAPVNYGINQKANPEVDVKNLTSESASKVYKDKYWNAIDADRLPPATARVAYDAAVNQGVNYAKKLISETGGDPEKMLVKREQDYIKLAKDDPRQQENLNGWLNRVNEIRQELKPVSVATTDTGSKSYSEALAEKAGKEKFAEQESTAVGKAAGERRAVLENLRSDLGLKLKNANSLLTILDETPEAVGIGFRGPGTGAVVELGRQGKLPLVGKADVEELLATQMTPKARENRAKFDSIAAAVVAEERRNLAKGTGTVSNYETEQFEKATGLNKKSPAEANRYFAVFIAENLRAKAKLIDALDKNPKQSMVDFERSSEYKRIMSERDSRLEKIFPELSNKDIGLGPKTSTTGANDDEIASWRKRYGNKKESQ